MKYNLIIIENNIAGIVASETGEYTLEQAENAMLTNKLNASESEITSIKINKENQEKFNLLRIHRNRLLEKTDHWAYQDTQDMTQEQIAYRQALRDITEIYSSLDDVVWPNKPV